MQEVFHYDSKFMQMLLKLADMLILNFIFILCCIPIFTIGAAQAGLFSGIRQMMNKEDDSSCIKAFFKGFSNGFGKITLVHTCFLLVIALLGYTLYAVLVLQEAGYHAPVWMCILSLVICVLFHSMLAPFHASFGCTAWQLVRNMYYVVMAYFLRAVVAAVLVWLPVGVLLLDAYIFMRGFPIWNFLYYSFAYLLVYSIMQKPFAELKQDFLDSQKNSAGEDALPEQTEA